MLLEARPIRELVLLVGLRKNCVKLGPRLDVIGWARLVPISLFLFNEFYFPIKKKLYYLL